MDLHVWPGSDSNSFSSDKLVRKCDKKKLVQSLSCVLFFAIPWTAAQQASLSLTISWSLLKLMSIESVNIQGWFPLGLSGSISLLSKGLKSVLQHHS